MELSSKKFAIFASGEGSNAINLLNYFKNDEDIEFTCIITDRKDAGIIAKVKKINLPIHIIEAPLGKDKGPKERKENHEKEILKILEGYNINWLCLAGYMRLLGPKILEHFWDPSLEQFRILNIHPSLLPDYPGVNSYKRAFDDNVVRHGVTVHYVDKGMDTGDIIIQKSFIRDIKDSLDDFIKNGKIIEHEIYPMALKIICQQNRGDINE